MSWNLSWLCLILTFLFSAHCAAATFVVEDIKVQGLQRVDIGTVYNDLPIKVGDTFDTTEAPDIIRTLYRSGFFSDIRLAREDSTLIVTVEERPVIGSIKVAGNNDIATDDLLEALSNVGIAEGRTYAASILERVAQEMEQQYFSRGKYGIKIVTQVTPMARNRVGIDINLVEGKAAKIRQINVLGNVAFSTDELLAQIESTTPGWFTWFAGTDQYSKERLQGDLEALSSYYFDRGYLNFTIDSTQVAITPDKKDIYITLNLTEGQQYYIGEITIIGDTIIPEEELSKFILAKSGELFNRRLVTESANLMANRIGNDGYAFAKVTPVPQVVEGTNQVKLTFFVDPGKRVYVRRINISGNQSTRDEVIRRQVWQMESAWASTELMQLSRTNLLRTGFFEEATVTTIPVSDTVDQVDLEVNVQETMSGRLTGGLGYSQVDNLIFNAGVQENNFLGTGTSIGFDFQKSSGYTRYRINHTDPFYTIDGVSRGMDVYYQQVDENKLNITNYTRDILGGNLIYGIPLSPRQRLNGGMGYDNTLIKISNDADSVSEQVRNFIDENGERYHSYKLVGGWAYNSFDRAIFPEKGLAQNINFEIAVPGSTLNYYKVRSLTHYYLPLLGDFITSYRLDLGYGDGYGSTGGSLPFFLNYYAGGIGSVRGYMDNTLGPKDSLGDPIGGNILAVGSFELIFPTPFAAEHKSVRTSLFLDGGNVFMEDEATDDDGLRFAAGTAVQWLSPLGPLVFSLGFPLNDKRGDETQVFQFTIGAAY